MGYYEDRKKLEEEQYQKLRAAAGNIYNQILASLTARGVIVMPRTDRGWSGNESFFLDHDTMVLIEPHKEYGGYHSTLTGKISISFRPNYKIKTRASNIKVDPDKFDLEAVVTKILARQELVNVEMAVKGAHEDKFAPMDNMVKDLIDSNTHDAIGISGNKAELTGRITVTCKTPEELREVYNLVAGHSWRREG